MTFEEVYSLSAEVQRRFLGTDYFRSASRLSLYSSFANEVVTEDVLSAAVSEGKEVYFPRVTTRPARPARPAPGCEAGEGSEGAGGAGEPHLEFYRADHAGELTPGSFEILEPCPAAQSAAPLDLDVIVVPGVVFDKSGGRLGFGKGYYDRALAGVKCPVVGFAFERQIYDGAIPVEAHDVRMTAIITESAVYEIQT